MSKEKELFDGLEITPEMPGIHAINPFFDTDTSSRLSMFGNHFSQALVLNNGEEKRIQTGVESVISRHTHSIVVPADCTVVKIIPRYRSGLGLGGVKRNDEYLLIYEEVDTLKLGCLTVKTFGSHHTYFGYNLKTTEHFDTLTTGSFLEKGTPLAVPISVRDNDGYSFGINLNTAYMAIPEVAEDGFVISESAVKRLGISVFEKRQISVGEKDIPLNLYGDEQVYRSFPEIGEKIHESGVVMATRDYVPSQFPTTLHPALLREIEPTFDKLTYSRGPDGVVVDVKVHHNMGRCGRLFEDMAAQLERYSKANQVYYQEILTAVENHMRVRTKYPLEEAGLYTEDFNRVLIEAMSNTSSKSWSLRKTVIKTSGGDVMDEFRVDLVIKHDLTPDIGWKLTDMHGGKGVIAIILPDDCMPVDSEGNRADIIVDPASVIGRINPGREYEQYINGAIVKAEKQIRNTAASKSANAYDKAFETLLEFLSLVSPQQYSTYKSITSPDERKEIIDYIINEQLMIYYPVDGKRRHMDVVTAIESHGKFAPPVGPVSHMLRGERDVTVDDVIIAPQYFMLLEKIADVWQSAASTRVNHFRVPATINRGNKHRLPWRASIPRMLGETETRIISSFCPPEVITELMDRATNIQTHLHIYERLLKEDYPTRIDRIVDRKRIPYGNGNIERMVKQMMNTAGFDIQYEPEEE